LVVDVSLLLLVSGETGFPRLCWALLVTASRDGPFGVDADLDLDVRVDVGVVGDDTNDDDTRGGRSMPDCPASLAFVLPDGVYSSMANET